MNNDMDDNLDLLDLEDDTDLSDLPETSPFTNPRPKKPWLLMGIGLLVIILATYIIIRSIGSDSSSSVEVDLDTPVVTTVDSELNKLPDTLVVPPAPVPAQIQPAAPAVPPKPLVEPVRPEPGVPLREVNDRKEVTFNPSAGTTAKPAPAAVVKPKPLPKKPIAAVSGSWYVQFGSYSTRALAEVAQKKIGAKHSSLFADKQFVILAAVLPNGTTTYRLRIAFADSADANGFCRNAKSDGLDCYVAR
ncbi:MAG: SPOR domain-containing protein [Alphaproteobacteria bacterium]|nr:SPOR domain-containing protein [Alphaproteobacteria bacterium]MBN2675560.1 SPOR domain-containing protein [Alphaproteobacteria bacterium]